MINSQCISQLNSNNLIPRIFIIIFLVVYSLTSFSSTWLDNLTEANQQNLISSVYLDDYSFKIHLKWGNNKYCLGVEKNQVHVNSCSYSNIKKWSYTRIGQLITKVGGNFYCLTIPLVGGETVTIQPCDAFNERQRITLTLNKISPKKPDLGTLGIELGRLKLNSTSVSHPNFEIDTKNQNTAQLFSTPVQPYLQFKINFKTTDKASATNNNGYLKFTSGQNQNSYFDIHKQSFSILGSNNAMQCLKDKRGNSTWGWVKLEGCWLTAFQGWKVIPKNNGTFEIHSSDSQLLVDSPWGYTARKGSYSSTEFKNEETIVSWGKALKEHGTYYAYKDIQKKIYSDNVDMACPATSVRVTRSPNSIKYTTADNLSKLRRGQVRVYWLNVGQGSMVIIDGYGWESPVIVDAGALPDSENIRVMTRDQAVEVTRAILTRNNTLTQPRRPIVVVSHPDIDHYNYLSSILPGADTAPSTIWIGGALSTGYSADFTRWVRTQRDRHGTEVRDQVRMVSTSEVDNNTLIQTHSSESMSTRYTVNEASGGSTAGGLVYEDAPTQTYLRIVASNPMARNSNERSLVLHLQVGNHLSTLFMGDATGSVENRVSENLTEMGLENTGGIVTASHHGTNTHGSNGAFFIDLFRFGMAIAQTGAKEFQHPRLDVICRYIPYLVTMAAHSYYYFDATANSNAGEFSSADAQTTDGFYSLQETGAIVATITPPSATRSSGQINTEDDTEVSVWNGGSESKENIEFANEHMKDNSENDGT